MITNKFHIILLVAVAIPGSLLYFYFDPASSSFYPPCPFYALTGFFCPGCGSQRAFHDLLHGDIIAAAGHNLMLVAALPVIGISGAVTVNNIIRFKKMKQPLVNFSFFAWAVLAFVLLFWLLRNIPSKPFSWLAP